MIKLPMPPTSNHLYRSRVMAQKGVEIPGWLRPKLMTVTYKSSEAEDWQADARELYAALRPLPKGTDLDVVVGLWMPRKGTDIENRLKVMLDAFNELAWDDDSQIARLDVFRLGFDTKNPRAELSFAATSQLATSAAYADRARQIASVAPVEPAKRQAAWDFTPKPATVRR